jgi:hypothetical protein
MEPEIVKWKTPNSEIWIDAEGVLCFKVQAEAELELEEIKTCFEIYRKLGCAENKVLQLMYAGDEASMTREARDYAAAQGHQFFIASAIISTSLAIRIVVNFFNTFYNNPIPFKMFSTEEEARDWLYSFRK